MPEVKENPKLSLSDLSIKTEEVIYRPEKDVCEAIGALEGVEFKLMPYSASQRSKVDKEMNRVSVELSLWARKNKINVNKALLIDNPKLDKESAKVVNSWSEEEKSELRASQSAYLKKQSELTDSEFKDDINSTRVIDIIFDGKSILEGKEDGHIKKSDYVSLGKMVKNLIDTKIWIISNPSEAQRLGLSV